MNKNWVVIIFVEMKFFMMRTIFLFSMSLVMIASVLAPTGIILADVKIEILEGIDSSEGETHNGEHEVYEKEIIDHRYYNHELFVFKHEAKMNRLPHDYLIKRVGDIFLPPPEYI